MDEYINEEGNSLIDEDSSLIHKIPVRIKSGRFEDDMLVVETSGEPQGIPFESIEYICLGIIEEKLTTSDPPKSNMRNMIQGLFGGGDKADKNKKIQPSSRTTHILDIYVKDLQAPFRIDASSVNYKEFLGKVSYISANNFRLLLTNICALAEQSRFNNPIGVFLNNRKEKPQIFESRNEFELVSSRKRQNLDKELTWDCFSFEELPKNEKELNDSWDE